MICGGVGASSCAFASFGSKSYRKSHLLSQNDQNDQTTRVWDEEAFDADYIKVLAYLVRRKHLVKKEMDGCCHLFWEHSDTSIYHPLHHIFQSGGWGRRFANKLQDQGNSPGGKFYHDFFLRLMSEVAESATTLVADREPALKLKPMWYRWKGS